MAGVLRWYQAKLASRPVFTQAVSTAVLFATGDVLAQQVVEKRGFSEHTLERTGRMALYGGCVFGPGATLWYQFLQRKIVLPGKPNLEILARVATDQTVFASTNLFLFLSSMAIMEGSDPKAKLEASYWEALKKNWMVWPGAQFVNFKYVPLEYRVLVVNGISIGELSVEKFYLRKEFVTHMNMQAGTATSASSTAEVVVT
ncbi:unnamed protein product [Oppiella nova]|uniref:Mitochondrial inner membrane protein Mpv17 n=1 Tax=Oppiella nova TaxID=334625 RepID=A0A7R9MJF1_9ACAR|nr:unnamed protein product [Oppiella nova]CAG2178237.1 unnamed protein product [Oppiella nova]